MSDTGATAPTRQRDDAPWLSAALAFLATKREADAAGERLEAARQALVALAEHPKECGAGVSVTRYWKVGNVDYKRVPALNGVDLAASRGKAREEVRVTTAT